MPQPTEHQVRAAFLLNFLKFVEWPDTKVPAAGAPFVVVVLGDAELAAKLATALNGRAVLRHPVAVRSARDIDSIREAHLVFIAPGATHQLASVVRATEGRGVLTVGDTPGFAEAGVVINLYVAGDRMRFEVNTAAAARARVRLSSQLLRLARLVG